MLRFAIVHAVEIIGAAGKVSEEELGP